MTGRGGVQLTVQALIFFFCPEGDSVLDNNRQQGLTGVMCMEATQGEQQNNNNNQAIEVTRGMHATKRLMNLGKRV